MRKYLLIFPLTIFAFSLSLSVFAFSDSEYSVELLHPEFKTLKYEVAQAWGKELARENDSIFCFFSGDAYFTWTQMWMLRVVDEYFVEEAIYDFNYKSGGVSNTTIRFTSIKKLKHMEDFWVPVVAKFKKKRVSDKFIWGELFDVCLEAILEHDKCIETKHYTFNKKSKYSNKSLRITASSGQKYQVIFWEGSNYLKAFKIRSPRIVFEIPHLYGQD